MIMISFIINKNEQKRKKKKNNFKEINFNLNIKEFIVNKKLI